MISEDYVSFKTSKLLKEKGFEGNINAYYHIWDNGNRVCSVQEFSHSEAPHLYIPAPTLQMAMKWLREEKKIGIEVNINFNLDNGNKWHYEYGFCIFQLSGSFKKFAECDYDGYKTYEEACEAAIRYCLENLI